MIPAGEFRKFEMVAQKIFPDGKLLRAWGLKGGISAEMTALEIECQDGISQKLIVRRPGDGPLGNNPRAAEDEFKLLQITRGLGLATQIPYLLDPSGQIFPTPYLVIEYIEGQPDFTSVHTQDFIDQFAVQLAKIHQADLSHLDLSFLPKLAASFKENFGSRPERVDKSLDEGRIRDMLESAWPFPQRNVPVLLHGDYWPGNVLWQENQLVAVIDWEDGRLGDALIDLSISRLDILWIFGTGAMDAFTRRYQSLRAIDTTALPLWDLCAALRLVRLAGPDLAGWADFFRPYDRPDITEQTIRAHYRFFIDQAFEKLAK